MLAVVGVYVAAILAAIAYLVFVPSTGWLLLDTFLADLVATMVIFAASRITKNSSFYDAFWSVSPPLLVGFWAMKAHPEADWTRITLLSVVVVLWSVRLTGNWVLNYPGHPHEDWRYDILRARAPKVEALIDFFAIHVFPTIQVFLGMLPVFAVTVMAHRAVTWSDWVAFAVGLFAVILAFVADGQMRRWVRDHPGKAMQSGLWAWSRHPNYLGEFLFWVALLMFGLSGAVGAWWWMVLGVIAMLGMFLFASIPMMEQRSLERRPEYAEVIQRVSKFWPRPPKRAA